MQFERFTKLTSDTTQTATNNAITLRWIIYAVIRWLVSNNTAHSSVGDLMTFVIIGSVYITLFTITFSVFIRWQHLTNTLCRESVNIFRKCNTYQCLNAYRKMTKMFCRLKRTNGHCARTEKRRCWKMYMHNSRRNSISTWMLDQWHFNTFEIWSCESKKEECYAN